MNFREFLKDNIVLLDGALGTLLQREGLNSGEYPEQWNLTRPEIITKIHKDYIKAGSNVISANTFGANTLKFPPDYLREIVCAAIKNARRAIDEAHPQKPCFVALDIGPLGRLLKPLGDLDFEKAVEIFKTTARLGEEFGADLILIETMNDSYETKAALLAVKESTSLPVIVSNAYSENGSLLTGAPAEAMIALLEGMRADAIGVNCSFGPDSLMPIIEKYLKFSSSPVLLMPNAGMPRSENGKTVYDISPTEFADSVLKGAKKGVRLVGGCCGTTPEYIEAVNKKLNNLKPCKITPKDETVVCSYQNAVGFDKKCVLIGERINPTGKKRFKQALLENDIDYILKEAARQEQCGAQILDVNVGLPDIDEADMLTRAIFELQTVVSTPLQIDSSDYTALERAMRIYNGKAMINSVNGKKESMNNIFPLVQKYGGVLVALTLDENGIPATAEGRVQIAKKILNEAKKYGIDKKDIIFDTLAMTISADANAALTTLEALKRIKNELGCKTSLGISNVSFGLPCRDTINSTFFTLALQNGLSAAIMNPYSKEMLEAYYAFNALSSFDENCTEYIGFASDTSGGKALAPSPNLSLEDLIIKGFKSEASEETKKMLSELEPLDIVNGHIVPALDKVGKEYELGNIFLPQLLISAEAAKNAFEEIKKAMPLNKSSKGAKIVIATVSGDIHDIGKNIVKLLLENYGFDVIDLGKDVSAEVIIAEVCRQKAPILALSALMTTTVVNMQETITLLKKEAPFCKCIVGGAVLNEEYANKIGADKYARDAMAAVRCAKELL